MKLFKGGQGRSDKDIEETVIVILWLTVIAVIWAVMAFTFASQ
jgi:hypothetical protein